LDFPVFNNAALRHPLFNAKGLTMTINELGNLGEFIGSIAVVISLIFVGLEIRKHTRETRIVNARYTAGDQARALLAMTKDEETASLMISGFSELKSMTPVERFRFDMGFLTYLQVMEQAFTNFRYGDLDDDILTGYRNALPSLLNASGGEQWWAERKYWFSHAFRKEVEELLNNPPEESRVYSAELGVEPGN
jgi:hypothetical protein